MKSQKLLIGLIRSEFDASKCDKEYSSKLIDAAVEVAGEDNEAVIEMISDFECEFNNGYISDLRSERY